MQPKNEWYLKWYAFVGLLFLIVLIWAGSGLWLFADEDRGTFGDMFGAINSLFSGLAFASLVFTILMQRKELELQRSELALTRTELEGQKNQLIEQNKVMRAQNFESTFFQLLRLFNETTQSIDLPVGLQANTTGRDCFEVFYQDLKVGWSRNFMNAQNVDFLVVMDKAYSDFYRTHEGDVGHYFRTLYNLVKFVHNSKMDDKRLYTNLVRAQLSSYELLLLFYNCLSNTGREKFKPLVEEYSLLKTVPRDLLINQNDMDQYSSKAFN